MNSSGLITGTHTGKVTVLAGGVERSVDVELTIGNRGLMPGQELPTDGNLPACGVGLCGAGVVGLLPLMLLILSGTKLGCVRARRTHG